MYGLIFSIHSPVEFCVTGKFEAPSSSYVHLRRSLHYSYELCVVTKGILYISYQNQKYRVGPGEYLLMHPSDDSNNCQYGYRPSLVEFYWLHFTTPYPPNPIPITLHSILPTVKDNCIVIPSKGVLLNPEKVLVLFCHLQDYARNNYNPSSISYEKKAVPNFPFTKPVIDYLTTAILCEIYSQECLRRLPKTQKQNSPNLKKRIYHSILDYIQEHPTCNLKSQDIAAHFGYNEKYLSRLFRSLTGYSLKEYLIHKKIQDANRYLEDTDLSVLEIALALGFSDAHNFMKLYKKNTGLTPSEYRNAFPKRIILHT